MEFMCIYVIFNYMILFQNFSHDVYTWFQMEV
jgi:hypothetical protein